MMRPIGASRCPVCGGFNPYQCYKKESNELSRSKQLENHHFSEKTSVNCPIG